MDLLALEVILDLPSVLVHSRFSTRCQSIDPQREMKAPFRDLEVYGLQDRTVSSDAFLPHHQGIPST